MKIFTSISLIISVLLSLLGIGKTPDVKPLADYNHENTYEMSMLSVNKNGKLVNEDGKKIVLNGVNIGNWLLWETWMGFVPEYTNDWAHYDTLQVLTERFGEEKTAEIEKTFMDNFITEDDIAQIEKLGFNCVRVPFWYRNFMNEDGTWLTENHNDNPGFKRIDWLIEICEKYGIYIILDMHGAPGGQSKNHSTGKAGRNELYEVKEKMDACVELWTTIAERYKDSYVVAAYDLLNEPQNNGGYSGDYSWEAGTPEAMAQTNKAYDILYKAIREVDENHIISFEGIWSTDVLPNPKENGYENVMYQLHIYDKDKNMINYRVNELRKIRKKWNVAVYNGEYNNGENEHFAQMLYKFCDINRTKWNYKTFNAGKQWGLFNQNVDRIDIKTASYEEIIEFVKEIALTDSFEFNDVEMSKLL
ncbi:MAG: cellulase family glycosylhydrolase [Clostridia bacterium]|nr:cellulase family glycosylhydrolase [Clostridia bacterium]